MSWKSIRKEQPGEYDHVLVSRDHFGDEAYDYFVASYWAPEEEWHVFMTIPGPKGSSYITVQIPAKKDDVWMHIPDFEE